VSVSPSCYLLPLLFQDPMGSLVHTLWPSFKFPTKNLTALLNCQ
jgi:hypothetical protein